MKKEKAPQDPSDTHEREERKGKGAEGKKRKGLQIVALGGSAGGLEAFEVFFRNMPPTAASPSWSSRTWTRPSGGACPRWN